MLELIGKSISCILCRGSILYFDETGFEKFSRHLQFEHGAMHDFEFMLAACKMNDNEKVALVSVFNQKTNINSSDKNVTEKPTIIEHSKSKVSDVTEKAKVNVENEKKTKDCDNKSKKKMFSKQKRKIINFKTSRKRKFSCVMKNVGNNIIAIKNLKAKKVKCGKCFKKFKSRAKLFQHKALEHLSLSVKPRKAKIRKKVEPLKKTSYIAAASAGKAVEALVVKSSLTQQTAPIQPKLEKNPQKNIFDIAAPSKVNDASPTVPNKEIKEEIKDSSPLTYLNLVKIGSKSPTNIKKTEKKKADTPPPPPPPTPQHEAFKSPEKEDSGCIDCKELSGSASKLSRHKRYVHGLRQDSPKHPKRDAKKASVSSDSPKVSSPSSDPPKASSSSSDPPKVSSPSSDPPKVSSLPSGPPKVSSPSSDPPKVSSPSSDPPKASSPSSDPPKVSSPSSDPPKVSSPSSDPPMVSSPSSDPPKVSPQSDTSHRDDKKDTKMLSPECSTPPKSEVPKASSSGPPKASTLSTPNSGLENIEISQRSCMKKINSGPRRLSVTFSNRVHYSDNTSVEHLDFDEDVDILVDLDTETSPKRGSQEQRSDEPEPPYKKLKPEIVEILKPAPSPSAPSFSPPSNSAPCPSPPSSGSPSSASRLKSNSCVDLTGQRKNYVDNSLEEDDKQSPDIILDEAVIVRVNENVETGFAVRPEDDSYHKDSPGVTQTVPKAKESKTIATTHPFESYVETVLFVEEKEEPSPVKNLQNLYKRGQKEVDFTKSNFFMKNAELLGGVRTSRSGYREEVSYLPRDWRLKTYNECKTFYLTPDLIVLKSSCAVLEYLRLGYSLSQENLRTLADCLDISKRVFNRYLDELFDDCVVLD